MGKTRQVSSLAVAVSFVFIFRSSARSSATALDVCDSIAAFRRWQRKVLIGCVSAAAAAAAAADDAAHYVSRRTVTSTSSQRFSCRIGKYLSLVSCLFVVSLLLSVAADAGIWLQRGATYGVEVRKSNGRQSSDEVWGENKNKNWIELVMRRRFRTFEGSNLRRFEGFANL